MAAPGVQSQDGRKKGKNSFFIGIQRGRLGSKVRPGEARFGPELDGEKLWRRQPGWAQERKEKSFFLGIQRGRLGATRGGSFWTRIRWGKAVAAPGRLGPKVRPEKARFGSELGGEKLWRRQVVFGARMGARKERNFFFRKNRDSEGAFGIESATRGTRFGPELDGEKLWRRQVFGARMGARKERKVF